MHLPHTKLVRRLAAGNWGCDVEDVESAEKSLLADSDQLSAHALLEIVKRLNQAIKAWETDDYGSTRFPLGETPDKAERIPGVHVGQVLYCCDSYEPSRSPVEEWVVVHVTEDGHALVTESREYESRQMWASWAGEGFYLTLAEALESRARAVLDRSTALADWSRSILTAVKSGATEFDDEPDFENEDE